MIKSHTTHTTARVRAYIIIVALLQFLLRPTIIHAATFDFSRTTMTCSPNPITAPGTVSCTLSTFDTTGQPYVAQIGSELFLSATKQVDLNSLSGTDTATGWDLTFDILANAWGTAVITYSSVDSGYTSANSKTLSIAVNNPNLNTNPIDASKMTMNCSTYVTTPGTRFVCQVLTRDSSGNPCACSLVSDFVFYTVHSTSLDSGYPTEDNYGYTLSGVAVQPTGQVPWIAGFSVTYTPTQTNVTQMVVLTGSVSTTASIQGTLKVGNVVTIVFSGTGLRFQGIMGGAADTVKIIAGQNADCSSSSALLANFSLGNNPAAPQYLSDFCPTNGNIQTCAAFQLVFTDAGTYTICYDLVNVGMFRMTNSLVIAANPPFDPTRSVLSCSPNDVVTVGSLWTCTYLTYDITGAPCSCANGSLLHITVHDAANISTFNLTTTSVGYTMTVRIWAAPVAVAGLRVTYTPTNLTQEVLVDVYGSLNSTFSTVPNVTYIEQLNYLEFTGYGLSTADLVKVVTGGSCTTGTLVSLYGSNPMNISMASGSMAYATVKFPSAGNYTVCYMLKHTTTWVQMGGLVVVQNFPQGYYLYQVYNGTVAGTFKIDGVDCANITLTRGLGYIFNVHQTYADPFYIKSILGPGANVSYVSGITNNGVTDSLLFFVVPLDAPDLLYYQSGSRQDTCYGYIHIVSAETRITFFQFNHTSYVLVRGQRYFFASMGIDDKSANLVIKTALGNGTAYIYTQGVEAGPVGTVYFTPGLDTPSIMYCQSLNYSDMWAILYIVDVVVRNTTDCGYYIGGQLNPTLSFLRTVTYALYSPASCPMWITVYNLTINTYLTYPWVLNNGIRDGYVIVTPCLTCPNVLYYRSEFSPYQYGVINVYDTVFHFLSGNGTHYNVDGYYNPELTLVRLHRYLFVAYSIVGYPVCIKSALGSGTVTSYNDGVTNNCISSGNIYFTVPRTAPDTLYYQSSSAPQMYSILHIVDGQFNITGGDGTDFTIDGRLDPVIVVERGKRYAFILPKLGFGYKYWIKYQQTSGTAGALTTADGVTNNGASSGYIFFNVSMTAPDVLYYQEESHGAMNGIIYVVDCLHDVFWGDGQNYYIDYGYDPTITITRGKRCAFHIYNLTNYPFTIVDNLSSDCSGHVYNAGVVNNGVSDGYVFINTTSTTPNTLYYQQCSNSNMSGTIIIYTPYVTRTSTATPTPTSTSTSTPTKPKTSSATFTSTPTPSPTSSYTTTSTSTHTPTPTPTSTRTYVFVVGPADLTKTQVWCVPDPTVAPGSILNCFVRFRDANNNTVQNLGVPPSPINVDLQTGFKTKNDELTISFTAGDLFTFTPQVQSFYGDGIVRLVTTIGGIDFVVIRSIERLGTPDLTRTSVDCQPDPIVAGNRLRCVSVFVDPDGNPAWRVQSADYSAVPIGSTATVTYSYGGPGLLNYSFVPTIAGPVGLNVSLIANPQYWWSDTVTCIAGAPEPNSTVVTCTSPIVPAVEFECTANGRDKYNNTVDSPNTCNVSNLTNVVQATCNGKTVRILPANKVGNGGLVLNLDGSAIPIGLSIGVPGQVSPTNSYIRCTPPSYLVGQNVSCQVILRDIFNGPAYLADANAFRVEVTGVGQGLIQMYCNQPLGICNYTFSSSTPGVGGLNVSFIEFPDNDPPYIIQNVTFQVGTAYPSNTLLLCPPEHQLPGATILCTFIFRDLYNNTAPAPLPFTAFSVTGCVPGSVQLLPPTGGVLNVSFVALNYQSNITLHAVFTNATFDRFFDVWAPGQLDPYKSVLTCGPRLVMAGELIRCTFVLMDHANNYATLATKDDFIAYMIGSGNTRLIPEITGSTTGQEPTTFNLRFTAEYTPYGGANITFPSTTYANVWISSRVDVQPGSLAVNHTIVQCPKYSKTFSWTECNVLFRDMYDNPVNGTLEPTIGVSGSVNGSVVVPPWQINGGNVPFKIFVTGPVYTLAYTWATLVGGQYTTPQANTTIYPEGLFDPDGVKVNCSRGVVGKPVNCTVKLLDVFGGLANQATLADFSIVATSIGQPPLTVTLKPGTPLVNSTLSMTFMSFRPGDFNLFAIPNSTSDSTPRYVTAAIVDPSGPSAERSCLRCTPSPVYPDTYLHCETQFQDNYGYPLPSANILIAVPQGKNPSKDIIIQRNDSSNVLVAEIPVQTSFGTVFVTATLSGLTLNTSVSIWSPKGLLDVSKTSISCTPPVNSAVTAGTAVTCNIIFLDMFGGPASSVLPADFNVTSLGPRVTVTAVQNIVVGSGVYPYTFVPYQVSSTSGIQITYPKYPSAPLISATVQVGAASPSPPKTVLACKPSPAVPGHTVTCKASFFDSFNNTADSTLSSNVLVTQTPGGSLMQTSYSAQGPGFSSLQFDFTALNQLGLLSVQMTVWNSSTQATLSTSLQVFAEHNMIYPLGTVLTCTPNALVAGNVVNCSVVFVDAWGQPSSAALSTDFIVSIYPTNYSTTFPSLTNGITSFQFTPTTSGTNAIVLSFEPLRSSDTVRATVEVTAGAPEGYALGCLPKPIYPTNLLNCTLQSTDRYGNKASSLVPALFMSITYGDDYNGIFNRVDVGGVSTFNVRATDTNRLGAIQIKVSWGLEPVRTKLHTFEIVPLAADPTATVIQCSPSVIRAGGSTTCKITFYSVLGTLFVDATSDIFTATYVGLPQAPTVVSPFTLSNGVATGVFMSTTAGQFTLNITTTKLDGSSDGSGQVVSQSLTTTVKVLMGPPNLQKTVVSCSPNPAPPRSTVKCLYSFFDIYNNTANNLTDLWPTQVTILSGDDPTVPSFVELRYVDENGTACPLGGVKGLLTVEPVQPVYGTLQVVLTLQNMTFNHSVPIRYNDSGVRDPNATVVSCQPSPAKVGVGVECTANFRDKYGFPVARPTWLDVDPPYTMRASGPRPLTTRKKPLTVKPVVTSTPFDALQFTFTPDKSGILDMEVVFKPTTDAMGSVVTSSPLLVNPSEITAKNTTMICNPSPVRPSHPTTCLVQFADGFGNNATSLPTGIAVNVVGFDGNPLKITPFPNQGQLQINFTSQPLMGDAVVSLTWDPPLLLPDDEATFSATIPIIEPGAAHPPFTSITCEPYPTVVAGTTPNCTIRLLDRLGNPAFLAQPNDTFVLYPISSVDEPFNLVPFTTTMANPSGMFVYRLSKPVKMSVVGIRLVFNDVYYPNYTTSNTTTMVAGNPSDRTSRVRCTPNPASPLETLTCTIAVADLYNNTIVIPEGAVNVSSNGTANSSDPQLVFVPTPQTGDAQLHFPAITPLLPSPTPVNVDPFTLNYRVKLVSRLYSGPPVSTTTFTYSVEVQGPCGRTLNTSADATGACPALHTFGLLLPEPVLTTHPIVTTIPTVAPAPSSITATTPDAVLWWPAIRMAPGTNSTFTITLQGAVPEGNIQYVVANKAQYANASIRGPVATMWIPTDTANFTNPGVRPTAIFQITVAPTKKNVSISPVSVKVNIGVGPGISLNDGVAITDKNDGKIFPPLSRLVCDPTTALAGTRVSCTLFTRDRSDSPAILGGLEDLHVLFPAHILSQPSNGTTFVNMSVRAVPGTGVFLIDIIPTVTGPLDLAVVYCEPKTTVPVPKCNITDPINNTWPYNLITTPVPTVMVVPAVGNTSLSFVKCAVNVTLSQMQDLEKKKLAGNASSVSGDDLCHIGDELLCYISLRDRFGNRIPFDPLHPDLTIYNDTTFPWLQPLRNGSIPVSEVLPDLSVQVTFVVGPTMLPTDFDDYTTGIIAYLAPELTMSSMLHVYTLTPTLLPTWTVIPPPLGAPVLWPPASKMMCFPDPVYEGGRHTCILELRDQYGNPSAEGSPADIQATAYNTWKNQSAVVARQRDLEGDINPYNFTISYLAGQVPKGYTRFSTGLNVTVAPATPVPVYSLFDSAIIFRGGPAQPNMSVLICRPTAARNEEIVNCTVILRDKNGIPAIGANHTADLKFVGNWSTLVLNVSSDGSSEMKFNVRMPAYDLPVVVDVRGQKLNTTIISLEPKPGEDPANATKQAPPIYFAGVTAGAAVLCGAVGTFVAVSSKAASAAVMAVGVL